MTEHGSAALVAAVLAGLFGLRLASAQDSGSVTVDVRRCVALGSEAERLACFAAEVDAAVETRGPAVPEGSSAAEEREADQGRNPSAETAAARERRAESDAERLSANEPREAVAEAEEYFGTITALRERLPESYLITLDNGQIWEQTEPERYPLRPGLEVRVYPTAWGYRLSGAGTGRYIRVRRLR